MNQALLFFERKYFTYTLSLKSLSSNISHWANYLLFFRSCVRIDPLSSWLKTVNESKLLLQMYNILWFETMMVNILFMAAFAVHIFHAQAGTSNVS